MKTKSFDCVEMKRQGAQMVQKGIAELTPEQEVEFWREHTEKLRRKQKGIQDQPQPAKG
jgi:hypothetical protein